MLVDWFTVGAQALNFLILAWLLKHFLYKPILQAIATREKLIASTLADADSTRTEAEKKQEEFQRKNDEFDKNREALFDQATSEANAERKRLLTEARNAGSSATSKWQEALRREEVNVHQAVTQVTCRQVFSIAGKALKDLADSSLEERVVDSLIKRLPELKCGEKTPLSAGDAGNSNLVLVRSTFELPPPQRTSLEAGLKQTLGTGIQCQFDTAPEMISGIELSLSGQKLSWSIGAYLKSLEESVHDVLSEKDHAPPKPKSKPVEGTAKQVAGEHGI